MNIFLIPIIGGIIGYFTNWLAIKMIFRPYEEKHILGVKVPFTPGLIAVERKRITEQIGFVVTNHLLTDQAIKNKILEFDFNESAKKIILSLENEIKSNDSTFEAIIKDLLNDEYDNKLTELNNSITNYLTSSANKQKTDDELLVLENDLRTMLPDILIVIKTVFENNLYNIDSIIISILDDVIKNFTKGLGALFAGFINSEAIYVLLQQKIVSSIENDSDAIINKVIEIAYESNTDENEPFNIQNVTSVAIRNLMQTKVSSVSFIFDFLKNDEVNNKISDAIKKYLSEETDNIIKNIDLNTLIVEKMDEMSLSEIEELIMSISKREIKAITNIGGVLGFVIGLITILFY